MKTLLFSLLCICTSMFSLNLNAADLGNRNAILWEYEEWRLNNPSYSGNAYDLIARVTFTHSSSGDQHTTEMFYTGSDTWAFRFTGTRTGTWNFVTTCDGSQDTGSDGSLHGHTGSVQVAPNPDPLARGFLTGEGNKFIVAYGNSGKKTGYLFNVYMNLRDFPGTNVLSYWTDSRLVDMFNDAKQYGMEVVYFNISHEWFQLGVKRHSEHDSDEPDPESFVEIERILRKARENGMRIHFWAWADEQRKQTPHGVPGGINGYADRRVQRYIAARLGPIPGWSMGIGFDLFEWLGSNQANSWADYVHEHMGWSHLLMSRSLKLRGENCVWSYSSFDRPAEELSTTNLGPVDYDEVLQDMMSNTENPHLYAERHTYDRWCGYEVDRLNMDGTRRLMWWTAMAGGMGGWYGFFDATDRVCYEDWGRLPPYPNPEQMVCHYRFWHEGGRFLEDMAVRNDLSDGYCLKSSSNTNYVFYREDTNSVRMDLSGMNCLQPAVAIDTKRSYEEINLGVRNASNWTWDAPYLSDWAVAVGVFPTFQESRDLGRIGTQDSVTNEFASVPLWDLFETDLINHSKYSNPFRDVVLSAIFTSPSGKPVDFFGYYDGDGKGGQIGSVWKLRFMPDEIGKWSYTCQFSDGIPGKTGSFICVNREAKPGPLRAEGRWLRFANGERFYLRSYYLSEAFSGKSPHWENKVDMFFGGEYSYNFCCTTFWQGRLLAKNRWNNMEYNEFYPIYDEDYTRLDLRSWQHVDEVLQHLESHGAIWFNFDGFVPNVGGDMGQQRLDFDAQKVYIHNVVARFAPYWNVTWNIAFEWQEFMSADEVRRLVDFTKQIDPWNHLITIHDQGRYQTTKELIGNLHVDFVTLQYDAGKCGDTITANQFIQRYSGDAPVYAQEVCWEADSKLNAEQIRKGAWGVVLAGGLLNYAEMFEGPNQGKPENYGDGRALPQLEIMFDFLGSLPYNSMEPHNELVGNGRICFAQPGFHYVCYSPLGSEIKMDLSTARGGFRAIWINPRSGKTTNAGKILAGGKKTFLCPDEKDWLLHLLREE